MVDKGERGDVLHHKKRYNTHVSGPRLFKRHLEEGEVVIALVHKHWFLGLRFLFWPIITTMFLTVLLVSTGFERSAIIVLGTMLLCSTLWLIRNFLDYYLDAWIITNYGIIDVEWHGWFHRESSRVLYSDVQGVSYEIKGVFNTLLRYGTIAVEKVSTGSLIGMTYVSNPRRVEAIILKNMEEYLHQKNMHDASVVQQLISEVISRELQLGQFTPHSQHQQQPTDVQS